MISKLLRLYKRSHGLRQICNIVVYIAHSACTIHLLNLPEKNARRDIIHGVKHLEEIAEGWLCARRTLGILSVLGKRWKVELPEEATTVLARTDAKFGPWTDVSTPRPVKSLEPTQQPIEDAQQTQTSPALQPYSMSLASTATQFFDRSGNSLSMSSQAEAAHRTSEARSLPPNDANPLAYPRAQRQPADLQQQSGSTAATPASTQGRQSIDAASSSGNSPSQLFGGVDQLIREGQDWWLRDQNQLAVGFDNWNYNADDIASWFASQAGGAIGSPGTTGGGFATSPVLANGAGADGGGLNGVNGLYGGGIPYNEQDWYQ